MRVDDLRSPHQRLVGISKCVSGALWRKIPPPHPVAKEGRTPIRTAAALELLKDRHTTLGDTRSTAPGGGRNRKPRFELRRCRKYIRRPQGHTYGRGFRPRLISSSHTRQLLDPRLDHGGGDGYRSRRTIGYQRVYAHFYECDHDWGVMGGHTVRSVSVVAIIVDARQCIYDGILFYRSANDVVPSDGVNGVGGTQYFRSVQWLRHNLQRRGSTL